MPIERYVNQLRTLTETIRRRLERAEQIVPHMNQLIRQVAELGLADEMAFMGFTIYSKPYGDGGPIDSSRLFVAALKTPEGFGVAMWDSEEFCEFQQQHQQQPQQGEIALRFCPYEQCPKFLKALLLGQIEPMLREFCDFITPLSLRPCVEPPLPEIGPRSSDRLNGRG